MKKAKWIVALLLVTSILFCVVGCKNTAGDESGKGGNGGDTNKMVFVKGGPDV